MTRAAPLLSTIACTLALSACSGTRRTLLVTERDAGAAPKDATSGTDVRDGAPADAQAADAAVVFRPALDASFQVQLTGSLDDSVDAAVYVLDLDGVTGEQVASLQAAARRVVCYFSAGTHEAFRPDAAAFAAASLGSPLSDYPDEHWLDVRDATVRMLMAQRIERANALGCAAVLPANLDVALQPSGFPLQREDGLAYAHFLAERAQALKLGIALEGSGELAAELASSFDMVFPMGCLADGTCDRFAPFEAAGKPVLLVEFETSSSDFDAICAQAHQRGHPAILKRRDLGAYRRACP